MGQLRTAGSTSWNYVFERPICSSREAIRVGRRADCVATELAAVGGIGAGMRSAEGAERHAG